MRGSRVMDVAPRQALSLGEPGVIRCEAGTGRAVTRACGSRASRLVPGSTQHRAQWPAGSCVCLALRRRRAGVEAVGMLLGPGLSASSLALLFPCKALGPVAGIADGPTSGFGAGFPEDRDLAQCHAVSWDQLAGGAGGAQFSLNICDSPGTWLRTRVASCGRTNTLPRDLRDSGQMPGGEARPRLAERWGTRPAPRWASVRLASREDGWDVACAETGNHCF